MRLDAIVYDTATLSPGQREAVFFRDREGPALDETSRPEGELIEWLTENAQPRSLVLSALELPAVTRSKRKVVGPFLSNAEDKPGDIDLLLSAPTSPNRAVAIECKRVRVRAGSNGDQRVNRLEELADAPAQVNGLVGLGFHRTYLAVIVVAHDLSDRDYNFAFRGSRLSTFSRIVHLSEELQLDPRIGVLYVEIAQPSPDPIDSSGAICAGILRQAERVEQTHDLTSTVDLFFARSD